jgi:hypothetical protein
MRYSWVEGKISQQRPRLLGRELDRRAGSQSSFEAAQQTDR